MNRSFWNGKKVLMTGHTGFKGSWLSLWLQMLGTDLSGYALGPPTNPSLFEAARVGDGMCSVLGDVRDLDHLKKVLSDHRPEIIIHMAAQSLVKHSYINPIETYATNVMGTVNLLEAVRQSNSVRVVVNVTSDKCYKNTNNGKPYHENEPMGGYDPYSSSKGCAELVTSAYRDSFLKDLDISVATARAGNVIGGGDWAKDRLIPDILQGLLKNKPLNIRHPMAIRPWQHVLNPLEGYLMLAERLWEDGQCFSEGWNFGPDETENRSVVWVVNFMTKAWGSGNTWETEVEKQPHEEEVLRLDSSKARGRLAWSPTLSLEEGLISVIEWHRAFQEGVDMNELTLQQILRHQEVVQV